MIKRLKRLYRELRKSQKVIENNQKEFISSQKLNALMGNTAYVPETSWSMTPRSIVHCLNIFSLKQPQVVIEFGTGATTLYLAKLNKLVGSTAQIFSVESDKEWFDKMNRLVKSYDLIDQINLIYAPLKKVDDGLNYKEQALWYDTEALNAALANVEAVDFVIVDGPFGGSTPYARYSAVPYLKNKFTTETIVLLDDVRRADEKEILDQWKESFKNFNLIKNDRYAIFMSASTLDYMPYL